MIILFVILTFLLDEKVLSVVIIVRKRFVKTEHKLYYNLFLKSG